METLDDGALAKSRARVASYLRDVGGGLADDLSDEALRAKILTYERTGTALGIQSERAHMKWAYLSLIGGDSPEFLAAAKDALEDSVFSPDRALDDILNALDETWER